MKPSVYNLVFDYKNKKHIFNTFTCALAEASDEMLTELSQKNINLETIDQSIAKQMQDAGFIVNDETDELAILKYKYYKGMNPNITHITIVLTLLCNFECPYCYEKPNSEFIKDEVKEAIYNKIENTLKSGKKISVTWFGGEPLLAKNIIKEMSQKINQICKKYKTNCIFDMSTNGYLLDSNTIYELLECGVNSVQVTIDGTPEIHNMRRKLKGNLSDTFYKIIDNIKTGISMGMKFRIRINVDKSNVFCLEELLKILSENELQSCYVHIACVRSYSKDSLENTFNAHEFDMVNISFAKLLKQYGFDHYADLCYPHPIFASCSAGIENSVIIDPNGFLYRCFVELGQLNAAYGNILNETNKINYSINNIKYLMCSPFDKDLCKTCKVLPLCMGGCKYYTLKKADVDCSGWKDELEKKLSTICKLILN